MTRVVDGDTVEVTLPGSSRPLRVRLLDCWAPELKTPEGKTAKAAAVDLVDNAESTHLFVPAPETTGDLLGALFTFGRLLGHLFLSTHETLSERMVAGGWATRAKSG